MISAVAATASLKRRDSPFMNDTDVSPISRKRLRLSFDSREHVEEQKEQAENSVESASAEAAENPSAATLALVIRDLNIRGSDRIFLGMQRTK